MVEQTGNWSSLASFISQKSLSLDAAAQFKEVCETTASVDVPDIIVVHQARVITEWLSAQAGKPARTGNSKPNEIADRPAARIWQLLGDLLCCKYTSPHLQVPAFLVQGIAWDCAAACLQPTDASSTQLACSLDHVLHILHTKFEQSWRPTLEQLSSALQSIFQVVIALLSCDPQQLGYGSACVAWSCTATTAANIFGTTCAMHPVPRKVFSAVTGRLLPCLLQCCCPPGGSQTWDALRAACSGVLQQAIFNMQEISGVHTCLDQATAPLFVPTAVTTAQEEQPHKTADITADDKNADQLVSPIQHKPPAGSYHKSLLQGIESLLSAATCSQEPHTSAAAAVRSLPQLLEWFVVSWRRYAKSLQPDTGRPIRSKPADGQKGAPEFTMTAWLLDRLMQLMTKVSEGGVAEEPVEPKKKRRKTGKGDTTPSDTRQHDGHTGFTAWAVLADAAAKVVTVAKELQAYQPSKDVSGTHRAFLTRFAQQVVQQSKSSWTHTEAAVSAANLAAALLDIEIRCISSETEVLWQLCWQAAVASPNPHNSSPGHADVSAPARGPSQPHGALHLAGRLLIAALEIRQLQAALEGLMQQMTRCVDPHAAMVLCAPWFVDTLLRGVEQVPPGQKAGLVLWVADQVRMCSQLPDCPPELALPVAEICTCILHGVDPDLSTAPLVHNAACQVVSALADPLGQLLGVCIALETIEHPVLLQLWLRVFQGAVRLTSHCTCLLPSLDPIPGQRIKPQGNDSISAQALHPMTQHYFQSLLPADIAYASSSALDSSTLSSITHLISTHTCSLLSAGSPQGEDEQEAQTELSQHKASDNSATGDKFTEANDPSGNTKASDTAAQAAALQTKLRHCASSGLVLCAVVSILQRLTVLQERHLRLSSICPLITLKPPSHSPHSSTIPDGPSSTIPGSRTAPGHIRTEDVVMEEEEEDGDASDEGGPGSHNQGRSGKSKLRQEHHKHDEDVNHDGDDDDDDGDDEEDDGEKDDGLVLNQDSLEHVDDFNFSDMQFGEGPSELDELFRQELLADIEQESRQLATQLLQLFCMLATDRIAPKSKSQGWPSGTWAVLLTDIPAWAGVLSSTSPQQVALAVWMMMSESMTLWWKYCPDGYVALWVQAWLDACTCCITHDSQEHSRRSSAQIMAGMGPSQRTEFGVSSSHEGGESCHGTSSSSGAERQHLFGRHQKLTMLRPFMHPSSQIAHQATKRVPSLTYASDQLHDVVGNFMSWTSMTDFSQSLASSLPSALASSMLQLFQLVLSHHASNSSSSSPAGPLAPIPAWSKAAKKLLGKVHACMGDASPLSPLIALAGEIVTDCQPLLLPALLKWLKESKRVFRKSSKALRPHELDARTRGDPLQETRDDELVPGGERGASSNGVSLSAQDEEGSKDGGVPLAASASAASTRVAAQLLQGLQMMRTPDVLARLDVPQLQEVVSCCLFCAAAAAGAVNCYVRGGGEQVAAACSAWKDCYLGALNGAADGLRWIHCRAQELDDEDSVAPFLSECQAVASSLHPATHLLLSHSLASTDRTEAVVASCLVDSWTRLCQHAGCTSKTAGQRSGGKKVKKATKFSAADELHHLLKSLTRSTSDPTAVVSPNAVATCWLDAAGLCSGFFDSEKQDVAFPVPNTSDVTQAMHIIISQSRQNNKPATRVPTPALHLVSAHLVVWAAEVSRQQTQTGQTVGQAPSVQELQVVLQILPLMGSLLSGDRATAQQGDSRMVADAHTNSSCLHLLRALVSLGAMQGINTTPSLLLLSATLLHPTPLSLLSSAAAAKDSIAALVGAPAVSKVSFTAACAMALDAACALNPDPVFSPSMMRCQAISAAFTSILQHTCVSHPALDVTDAIEYTAKGDPATEGVQNQESREEEEDVREAAQGVVSLLVKVLTSSVRWEQLHAAVICCAVALEAPRGSPLQRSVSSNSSKLCAALCSMLARCNELDAGGILQKGSGHPLKSTPPERVSEGKYLEGTSRVLQAGIEGERDGLQGLRRGALQAGVTVVACGALHCLELMLGRPARFKLAGSMVVHVLGVLPAVLGVEQGVARDGGKQTRWEHDVEGGSLTIVVICQTLIALCRQHAEPLARGMAAMVDVQRALVTQLAAWAHKPDVLIKHSLLMDKCADALCRVWEVLAEHRSSLGKYCLHFIPYYINLLTLGAAGCPAVPPRNQLLWQPGLAALAPASPAQALRRGAYALMTCLSSHDLQYLHALGGQGHFGPTYREALAELNRDFERHFKYEGKV